MNTIEQTTLRFGMAWVALCLCLAVHVTDEALTGFLVPFQLISANRALRDLSFGLGKNQGTQ